MSRNKNNHHQLPTNALNLFDALINQIIDVTEQKSRDPNFLTNATNVAYSSTACTKYPCATKVRSFKKCTRPTTPHEIHESEKNYDFEKNTIASSSPSSHLPSSSSATVSENSQAIVDFENVEKDDEDLLPSTTTVDKLLQSGNSNGNQCEKTSSLHAEATFRQVHCCNAPTSPSRCGAGRDASSPQQWSSKISSFCSSTTSLPQRQGAGRDSPSNTSMSSTSSQRVKLITKRLAGGIEGCEMTVSTMDDDGNPFVIRAVCPNFDARRIWVNGQPFEYIDGESDNPLLDSVLEEDSREYEEEEETENGTFTSFY